MKFFRFFEKSMHGTLLIPLDEVTAVCRLKIDSNDFFGKSCVIGFLGKK